MARTRCSIRYESSNFEQIWNHPMSSLKKKFAGLNNVWIPIWSKIKILNIDNQIEELTMIRKRLSCRLKSRLCSAIEINPAFLPNLQAAIRGSAKRMNKRDMLSPSGQKHPQLSRKDESAGSLPICTNEVNEIMPCMPQSLRKKAESSSRGEIL